MIFTMLKVLYTRHLYENIFFYSKVQELLHKTIELTCACFSISKETKVAVTFILSSPSQVSTRRVLAAVIRTFSAWSFGCKY